MTLAKVKLPIMITVGSLITLLIIFLATSPVNDIGFIVLFFVIFFIFLNSLLYLITLLQARTVNRRVKQRVILASTSITVFLMFLSTKSLNLVDILILLLIIYGLYFYSGRR